MTSPRLALMSCILFLLSSLAWLPAAQPHSHVVRDEDGTWWCDAESRGIRCTPSGCSFHGACGALGHGVRAILLSDRLHYAMEVTMRSLCSFEPVELIFISSKPQAQLSPRVGACRLIPFLAHDIVGALERRAFAPLRVCSLNGSSAILSGPAKLQAASSHIKHAMCLNHLRFYLGELPVLHGERRVVLLDDALVLRRPLRELAELPMREGGLIATSCETFAWSRPCIGWSVSTENYSSWFLRAEHGTAPADFAALDRLGVTVRLGGLKFA